MKISRIEQLPYAIPFAADFQTARGEFKKRRGLILKIHTDIGLVGLGEAAPLPEFGGGTLEDTVAILDWLSPQLYGLPLNQLASTIAEKLSRNPPGWAAVACAFDIAGLDLLTQEAQIPLHAWTGFRANFDPSITPDKTKFVIVNATIGQADTAAACEAAKQAVTRGFACIKVKVGVAKTILAEVERLAALREAIGPASTLRIDANGAWTVAQAIQTLQALEEFNLELVEQPVAASDIAGLAQVRRSVKIPVAADEALSSVVAMQAIIEQRAADIAVIKPMLLGGLQAANGVIRQASTAGLAAFVTSSLDSGIAITAALHLAACLPQPRLACGLATAELLTTDLLKNSPLIQAGKMYLPDKPGLGVSLNENDSAFL